MKLVLTNKGTTAQLVTDPDGANVNGVEPGATLTINDERQVLIVGDKPSVREQIETALNVAAEFVKKIIETIIGRRDGLQSDTPDTVVFDIANQGDHDVRVILGDGVTDQTLPAGLGTTFSASGYLELRELGRVQQDPNQHEAA